MRLLRALSFVVFAMDNIAVHQASIPASASDAICRCQEWMLTLTRNNLELQSTLHLHAKKL